MELSSLRVFWTKLKSALFPNIFSLLLNRLVRKLLSICASKVVIFSAMRSFILPPNRLKLDVLTEFSARGECFKANDYNGGFGKISGAFSLPQTFKKITLRKFGKLWRRQLQLVLVVVCSLRFMIRRRWWL